MLILILGTCCFPTAAIRAQIVRGTGATPDEFKLDVGVGGGYTSNPGLRSDSGESIGDSVAGLRAGLLEHRTSPRTDWSARYESFYTRYGNNAELDSVNHALNFDGRYFVTQRSHLSLFEHFFYSRNPLQVGITAPTDEPVILTRHTNRWRSISDAGFDTSLSRSLVLLFGATSRVEHLDASPSIDSNTYSGRLGIQKQVGQMNSVSSTYTYSRFDFGGEDVAATEANGVDVSWSHGPPTGASCVLSAGMSRVTQEGASQNWLMAGATLHHPFRRFDFVSGYRRSLDADTTVDTVTVAQNAYAGLSATIGRSASLGFLGEYGSRDSVLATGDRLALTYTGGGLRGSISFDPRLSLSLEARRRKQTAAEGSAEDLTFDTLYLGLVFQVF